MLLSIIPCYGNIGACFCVFFPLLFFILSLSRCLFDLYMLQCASLWCVWNQKLVPYEAWYVWKHVISLVGFVHISCCAPFSLLACHGLIVVFSLWKTLFIRFLLSSLALARFFVVVIVSCVQTTSLMAYGYLIQCLRLCTFAVELCAQILMENNDKRLAELSMVCVYVCIFQNSQNYVTIVKCECNTDDSKRKMNSNWIVLRCCYASRSFRRIRYFNTVL